MSYIHQLINKRLGEPIEIGEQAGSMFEIIQVASQRCEATHIAIYYKRSDGKLNHKRDVELFHLFCDTCGKLFAVCIDDQPPEFLCTCPSCNIFGPPLWGDKNGIG